MATHENLTLTLRSRLTEKKGTFPSQTRVNGKETSLSNRRQVLIVIDLAR